MRLACVHKKFWGSGRLYHDPAFTDKGLEATRGHFRNTPKIQHYYDLIRSKGRVILTDSKQDPLKVRSKGHFMRSDYVGVFKIENFLVDADGMRFAFCEALARSSLPAKGNVRYNQ